MKSILGLFGLLFILPSLSFASLPFDHSRSLRVYDAPVTMGGGVSLPNGLQCMDKQKGALGLGNDQVLGWLKTTQNSFSARAMVQGKIIKRYPDRTDHAHFAIDLNGDGQGDLEVIYQNDFGNLPDLQPGMMVVACGDYITDHAHSPNGGIIHWVHCNPGDRDGGVHPSGFVMINGQVFGYSAPSSQPPCHIGQ